MTYTVTTISREVQTAELGRYTDKIEAMKVAKRASRTRKDCVTYGPSSIAYVGREVTAVVAW
jgi:hypothetical protein